MGGRRELGGRGERRGAERAAVADEFEAAPPADVAPHGGDELVEHGHVRQPRRELDQLGSPPPGRRLRGHGDGGEVLDAPAGRERGADPVRRGGAAEAGAGGGDHAGAELRSGQAVLAAEPDQGRPGRGEHGELGSRHPGLGVRGERDGHVVQLGHGVEQGSRVDVVREQPGRRGEHPGPEVADAQLPQLLHEQGDSERREIGRQDGDPVRLQQRPRRVQPPHDGRIGDGGVHGDDVTVLLHERVELVDGVLDGGPRLEGGGRGVPVGGGEHQAGTGHADGSRHRSTLPVGPGLHARSAFTSTISPGHGVRHLIGRDRLNRDLSDDHAVSAYAPTHRHVTTVVVPAAPLTPALVWTKLV